MNTRLFKTKFRKFHHEASRTPPNLARRLAVSAGLALLGLAIISEDKAMAIEEPTFKVVQKLEQFEIREYEPALVARVEVTGDFEGAGNQGFRTLADFIFGKNRSKTKIDMTAPVAMSEKIAMTAPVAMSGEKGQFQVEFTMPKSYTKATLPEPIDPRVQIIEVPAKLRAVHRYSGGWSEEKYLEHKGLLLSLIEKNGYEAMGAPVFSRFDPPFIPWFLRHNEVWIEVRPRVQTPTSEQKNPNHHQ